MRLPGSPPKVVKEVTVQINEAGYGTALDEDDEPLAPHEVEALIQSLRRQRSAYIYLAYGFVRKIGTACHKIGLSVNPTERLSKLDLQELHRIECSYEWRNSYEKNLHVYFLERGRWIDDEYFHLTEDDVEFVRSLKSEADIDNRAKVLAYGLTSVSYSYWRKQMAEIKAMGYSTLIEYYDAPRLITSPLPRPSTSAG